MATPLSSSEQSQIEAVENELEQYIKQSKTAGNQNPKALFSIQNKLTELANNPNIPDSVRQNLQAALAEIKQMQTTGKGNLTTARTQLDEALGGAESDEHRVGGGFLGSE